jgi:transcription initiation factor TFIIIB Brf1 subunit/transcription initiation factor TFIIB
MTHPLHTYLRVEDLIATRNPKRLTGRTTALAFLIIAEALTSPHTPIMVRDHHDDLMSHTHLSQKIQQLIHSAQLVGLTVGRYPAGFVLVYGTLTTEQQDELRKLPAEKQA